MKRLLFFLAAFCGFSAAAQTVAVNVQELTEKILKDEALQGAVVSICARGSDGNTIVDINSKQSLVPASNIKLISTGVALHTLGSGHSFETGIAYSGEICDSVLKGDIYIIGGGDPTLGSRDSIAFPLEKSFAVWRKMISEAGINSIDGYIIGDGSHFDGMNEHPSWLWEDIGTYYGAGATGLIFYENTQSFSVRAGSTPGDSVNIKVYYQEAEWMEFIYDCSTGEAGTGDKLYMYTSDLAPVAEIRGTFGVDRAAKRLDCCNKYPEYTTAYYFSKYLSENGIQCAKGPADHKLKPVAKADDITVLGYAESPSLERITFETNHASNNLYAETLYRSLGKSRTRSASYDSCAVALKAILKEMGLDTKGIQIVDGSGLSRQNYVSSDFFCSFLEAMKSSPCFDDYLASLPSPGKPGTLLYNMSKAPQSVRDRIRAKSGSMNGIRCYSGYILPSSGDPDDIISFSILLNNSSSHSWKLRRLLDEIMAAIATAN